MDEQLTDPIEVPYTQVSADALQGLIESFVLREGTDYGEREVSLESKVAGVMRQLENGEAQILFDLESESVTIVMVAAKDRKRSPPA